MTASLLAFIQPIWLVAQVFLLWLLADFLTGIVHWWEDAYGNPTWPILGKMVIQPNLEHHRHPESLIKGTYWNRIDTSVYAAIALGFLLWFLGWHSWRMIACVVFAAQANEIHAWAHRPDAEKGLMVRFLQRIGIFQGKRTHGIHHSAPYDTNFCVMTEYLNPILNATRFWERVEWVILKVFRIKVLRGSAVRGGI